MRWLWGLCSSSARSASRPHTDRMDCRVDFNEKSSRVKLLGLLVMFVVAMGGLATPAQADEPKGGDWQSVMDPSQWIEDPSYGPSKVSDSSSDSELVAAVADKVYRLGYSDGCR